jgi:hypothetical protein
MNKAILIIPVIAVLLGAIPSAMAQASGYNLTERRKVKRIRRND